MSDQELGTQRWKRLRRAILAQDDTCYLCGQPGADTVDHVIPRYLGGEVFDPRNCKPAHGKRNDKTGCPGNYGRTSTPALKTGEVTSREW